MVYWIIWFIGIGITILTRILLNKATECGKVSLEEKSKTTRTILYILSIICIIIVGGIAVTKWIGFITMEAKPSDFKAIDIFFLIFVSVLPALVTFIVGYFVLGLYKFEHTGTFISFILIFIISIVGWYFPINEYNKNIEITTETVIVNKEERELVMYCNIPVQKISGEISGSSLLGTGSVDGKIETTDELPYWYINKSGKFVYDTSPAKSSVITPISEEETPKIEIVRYAKQIIRKDNNTGKEKINNEKEWYKYEYYLAESLFKMKN